MSPFTSLNKYYDKIYILTLPRLKDRIAYIKKTFEGLDFEFFYGVDKENHSIKSFSEEGIYSSELYKHFYKSPPEMPLGMLCCALGHVNIYQKIVDEGFERTLILEDDAVPDLHTIKLFPKIVKEIPTDTELLYLGYEKNEGTGIRSKVKHAFYQMFPSNAQLRLTRQIFRSYYPRALTKHIARAGFHDCTHAYSITLHGAKKLLAAQHPIRFNPDNLLSYLSCTGKLHGYIVRPKLFNQLTAFNTMHQSLTGH